MWPKPQRSGQKETASPQSSTVVDDHAVAFAGLVEPALGRDALRHKQQVPQQRLVALLRSTDACHRA